MIDKVRIKNFKAFASVDISFTPLTLIMGENGVGKSTIVQAILLAKQNDRMSGRGDDRLYLNGPLVKIGNGSDALRQNADDECIGLDIFFGDQVVSWQADYDQTGDALPLTFKNVDGLRLLSTTNVRHISADRIGPQLTTPYSQSDASRRQIDERGTNALGLLHYSADMALDSDDPRVPLGSKSRSVAALFNHYLAQVSKGASLSVQDLSEIDSVSATFSFVGESELPMERIRPTNVGFGLSYCASVIVACLLSRRGDVLVIENPEAHLHTKGQRALAALMRATALAGVQVICETHSREILYALRKDNISGLIDDDLASVSYVFTDPGTKEKTVGSWSPLRKAISDLGDFGDDFLDCFGTPMDFHQIAY